MRRLVRPLGRFRQGRSQNPPFFQDVWGSAQIVPCESIFGWPNTSASVKFRTTSPRLERRRTHRLPRTRRTHELLASIGLPHAPGRDLRGRPVHVILTNRCYATGKWPYGVRNSRTGQRHDPASIVEIDVPTVIPLDLFEHVQARLAAHNPKVTPSRVVNGPTLLTGLAVCASCGAGVTRTGTRRRERSYSYYSCAGCQQKGKSVCQGRHMPMEKLDDLVIANVKERLFAPDRLAVILEALIERQGAKDRAVQDCRAALQGELNAKQDKLTRLYRAIEEGVIDLDDKLRDRVTALKTGRDIAQASLDRIAGQIAASAAITPERIEAFGKLVREKIDSADVQGRKSYLRSVIFYVEVDDDKVRIVGDKATLAAVTAGRQGRADNVRVLYENGAPLRIKLRTPM